MNERPLEPLDAADAAIDRAVREMMRAEPRPGFLQRVLARLDDEAPRRGWSWSGVSLAAAAAAAILILMFWGRPAERTPDAPVVVQDRPSTVVPQRESAPPPKRDVARIAQPAPRPAPVSVRPERGMVRAASLGPDAMEREMAVESATEMGGTWPAGGLEPISIAPLQIEPLTVPALNVQPLTIAPLNPPR